MAKLDGKHIGVLVTNGFEDSEFSSPVEAVRQAGGAGPSSALVARRLRARRFCLRADASTETPVTLSSTGLSFRAVPETLTSCAWTRQRSRL